MSLWSFQGARELDEHALREGRAPTGVGPSKLNSVRPALERADNVKRGRRCSRRTGSSDDAEHELEPSTSPAASGVRAPDSLERR